MTSLAKNAGFAVLLSLGCLLAIGCSPKAVAPPTNTPPAPSVEDTEARDSGPVAPSTTRLVAQRTYTNPLDATRAMKYLSDVTNLGPRPSGQPGMLRQQKYLIDFFQKHGAKVTKQEFEIADPIKRREKIACTNLIIEWHPDAKERVLLCAHYDTRPLPDEDPNPQRRRNGVFVGANDGASGVAVLMELAHHMKTIDPKVGVDFVLFDAEEYVFGRNLFRTGIPRGEYCLGSKHFAKEYRKNRKPPHTYHWGVLLDMVGDKNLEIKQELKSWSWRDTRPLIKDIWATAHRLGVKEFVPRTTRNEIIDDHHNLRNIGKIPTCDLIDAEYPDRPFGFEGSYWHTEQDIPSNCSGESLAKVGWVVLEWLKNAEARTR